MANTQVTTRFREVDVWRSKFGIVSVRAIREIYAQKFNIEQKHVKSISFSHCINALRLLEDPSYKKPENQISYK